MAYRYSPYATMVTIAAVIIAPIIHLAYGIADALIRAVMLVPPRFDWRMVRQLGVMAYRKIADLKPIYRESYETHGLSFGDGRMRC